MCAKSRFLFSSRLQKWTLQPPRNKLSWNSSAAQSLPPAPLAPRAWIPAPSPCRPPPEVVVWGVSVCATRQLCITGPPLWMWPYRRKLWGLHQRAKEPRRTKDKHSSRLRFIWKNNPGFLPGPHSFATASATPIAINMCWKQGNWCDPDGCI